MPTLILRFYGRFAYAVAKNGDDVTGRIAAIAPRFSKPFHDHQPMMTIPRSAVALGRDLTNLPPTLKVVSNADDVLAGEMFIWNLEGLNVDLVPDPGRRPNSATLGLAEPDRVIPDLAALLDDIDEGPASLDKNVLQASAGGKAKAVVNVTEGRGTAKMVMDIDNAFLIDKATATANPNPSEEEIRKLVANQHNRRTADGKLVPFKKADVVDFDIDVQRNTPVTLALTDANGVASRVSVVARETDAVVMVSFSNLCSTIPMNEVYDLEFAQYYQLLEQEPGDEALILLPSSLDDGGEPGECQAMARIDFQV